MTAPNDTNSIPPDTLKQLSMLKGNRHALNALSADEFYRLKSTLLTALGAPIINDQKAWYLVGTDGCHLCDDAATIISQALAITPDKPMLIKLDLADSRDTTLIDALGVLIPVLITDNALMCYPFGVMDVVNLAQSS